MLGEKISGNVEAFHLPSHRGPRNPIPEVEDESSGRAERNLFLEFMVVSKIWEMMQEERS